MKIGCRRVEPRLHAQRATQLQARLQFFGLEDFVGTTADQGKGFSGRHREQFQSGAREGRVSEVKLPLNKGKQ
jgi:hypothetical protein